MPKKNGDIFVGHPVNFFYGFVNILLNTSFHVCFWFRTWWRHFAIDIKNQKTYQTRVSISRWKIQQNIQIAEKFYTCNVGCWMHAQNFIQYPTFENISHKWFQHPSSNIYVQCWMLDSSAPAFIFRLILFF